MIPDRGRNNLINIRMVGRVLGILLLFEVGLLAVCMGVSLYYGEQAYVSFLCTMAVAIPAGVMLMRYGRHEQGLLGRCDSYLIVALSWVLFTLFGMLPFCIGGYVPSVTDAFFETMSGFTTTGATVLDNIDSLPYGLLFWRSLTQWIGGLGIIFFTVALLPVFGGSSQMLFLSESIGVTHDRTHARVQVAARWIGTVYILLTLVETLLLLYGGMNLFDAVCHAFATTATGGFSTRQASIAYWHSPFIEYVVSVFMLLSSVNFSLYFFALKGRLRPLFRDGEVRWFLSSVGILTVVIALALLWNNGYGPEEAFRKALFQVATCHTSCGFATDDYMLWPPFTWLLLLFAMFAGGCTGSTCGGVKSMRMIIIARCVRNQFQQILHPRAVLPVRVSGKAMDQRVVSTVLVFLIAYMTCIFVGWLILMLCGVEMMEAMGVVVSAIGNVGPGLGHYGPAYSWAALPDVAKWILSALMLVGRLEIFGVLIAFYPGIRKAF